MDSQWEKKRVLILVRTYPTPAKKGIEVSCTAAITESGEWMRLFPIPFRFLSEDARFKKYQWVELNVRRASADKRVESYNVDIDSIRPLGESIGTERKWAQRRELLEPLRAHCLCCLKEERNRTGAPTLGFFKPGKIHRLALEPQDAQWTPEELDRLRQYSMFGTAPIHELEKLPYSFKYSFECNHEGCPGHGLSCFDWEMGQAFRSWQKRYGSDWERPFRQKFEDEMITKNDTHFFVGTVHRWPDKWIIVGLFYPRL